MKSLQINIDFIVDNKELTALEKINKLDELAKSYANTIEIIKKNILKDYTYCNKCKDYYRKNSWEVIPLDNGKVQYECPKGHISIEDYWN